MYSILLFKGRGTTFMTLKIPKICGKELHIWCLTPNSVFISDTTETPLMGVNIYGRISSVSGSSILYGEEGTEATVMHQGLSYHNYC